MTDQEFKDSLEQNVGVSINFIDWKSRAEKAEQELQEMKNLFDCVEGIPLEVTTGDGNEAKVEKLVAVLENIAEPINGIEVRNADEESVDVYWYHIRAIQRMARKALSSITSDKSSVGAEGGGGE